MFHIKIKEQIKAKRAEESARKICARQEERVALLEGKLAELSETIGQYDLRRRRDQQLIQQLRDSINGRLLEKIAPATIGNWSLIILVRVVMSTVFYLEAFFYKFKWLKKYNSTALFLGTNLLPVE